MIEIDITTDQARPMLDRLGLVLRSRKRVNRAVAAGALPVFQGRFRELSSSNRNPFGVRGGFWNRMLSGTRASADDDKATISMPGEMRLRYYGGTVTPKKGKFLSIPAREEAYGKSPREFDDLRFVPTSRGGMLVKRYRGMKKVKGEKRIAGNRSAGNVFYWLVRSATIRGDPNVLPSGEVIRDAAIGGVQSYLERLVRRSEAPGPQ